MRFTILKKSRKSRARIGVLETEHGMIETPSFVPVATNAAVKTLASEEVLATKTQILIANTFHLHLKPGEKIVKQQGQLHKFMNWNRPLMTDSGGFQVFSLGFGKDFQVGKLLKFFPSDKKITVISKNVQPKEVKIASEGVYFRSPLDGRRLFLGPAESLKIQENLGADIIFAFDECTPPLVSFDYAQKSLERTHRWAEICLKKHRTEQALFGIIQGSRFKNLREESARFIDSLGFDGFGIGGDLGRNKKEMNKILNWVMPFLNEKKPRHLLGIGHLEDMEPIIKTGVDLFDCTMPTHYARRGAAFTSGGKLNLQNSRFLNDKKPLDSRCFCGVCVNYKRSYIAHLLRAKEITALRLLTFHNLYFFNNFAESIRKKIKKGEL